MFTYFAPEFDGYSLKQHDVEQYQGMSNETVKFREKYGEEPLWTNSMFGGMPTTQISTLYEGNIFQKAIIGFLRLFGVPSGIFLLHLLGFYILALCLRIRPLVGFIGALAFAFASYEIIIIQAGHNSKATTVALMAPVVGAFILAYRSNWKWGAILSALFMSFELASNHLQVTYYLGILLAGLGLYELVRSVRQKEIKQFIFASGGLIGAYLLALTINYGNITMTQDYASHTIRGGNDVTIKPDGTKATANTEGLDKDYITNWSYGVSESFTLISPYVKGSATTLLADSRFRDMVENSDRSTEEIKAIMETRMPLYWGDQPMTSGPVYVGVVMIFLMLLGLIYLKDNRKWILFGVGVLALMLSWGKNFMGLTDFFIENVPGYNKFRTVTIILVLIELIVPLIAILFLDKLISEREVIKEKKKLFYIVSGVFFVFLISVKMVGLGDNYATESERSQIDQIPAGIMKQLSEMTPEQLQQNGIDVNNPQQIQSIIDNQVQMYEEQFIQFKNVREEIFHSSMNRSLLFAFLGIGVFSLFFLTNLSPMWITGGLAVIVLLDFVPVDRNYLNSDTDDRGNYKYWMPAEEKMYPITATAADMSILEMESVNSNVKSEIEKGRKEGIQKAEELGFTGSNKNRVIESYQFAALNFATNYRVLDLNDSPFNSSRASYFHKSIGGYHGAKLRNIQNLIEFHISQNNNKVLDMLNVKYMLQGESARFNDQALGNAWLVKGIETYDTPNDEIRALGSKFEISNKGKGILLVNSKTVNEASVYGSENIQYIIKVNDTIQVPLSNGMQKGMEAYIVQDANGKIGTIPTMTMDADSTNSFSTLVSFKVVESFNPVNEAVMLKSEAKKLKNSKFTGEGSIKMTSYRPNKIEYLADIKGNQLAIFSEIYYPEGWKAFVDNKEVEIRKVNYLLRGLELENGAHRIRFEFNVPSYHKFNKVAVAGTILLGLFILFGIWKFSPFKVTETNS